MGMSCHSCSPARIPCTGGGALEGGGVKEAASPLARDLSSESFKRGRGGQEAVCEPATVAWQELPLSPKAAQEVTASPGTPLPNQGLALTLAGLLPAAALPSTCCSESPNACRLNHPCLQHCPAGVVSSFITRLCYARAVGCLGIGSVPAGL